MTLKRLADGVFERLEVGLQLSQSIIRVRRIAGVGQCPFSSPSFCFEELRDDGAAFASGNDSREPSKDIFGNGERLSSFLHTYVSHTSDSSPSVVERRRGSDSGPKIEKATPRRKGVAPLGACEAPLPTGNVI